MEMSQRTFTLDKSLGGKLYERFTNALASLKSDAIEQIEPYSRVTADDLTTLLEAAFWASLTAEEGRYHTFRISLGPPGELSPDLLFTHPKTYSSDEISDLAAVLRNNSKSLGVWYSSQQTLEIWGIADFPNWDVAIAANAPGQLLFSMLGGVESFKVAISGSWWGFIDNVRVPITLAYLSGMPSTTDNDPITDIKNFSKSMSRSHSYESIAKFMMQHGHGGTIVIVPEHHETWRRSIASIKYDSSVFEEVKRCTGEWDAVLEKAAATRNWFLSFEAGYDRIREQSTKALEFVAQLTAVDGAVILGRDLSLYGFGAKIKPVDADDRPTGVRFSRPFEDAPFEEIPTSDLGGTRHQSAAQFVHDQRDSVVIVCSQDGRLSSLNWDTEYNCVQVITNLEYAL
jgi:hypothetical protein